MFRISFRAALVKAIHYMRARQNIAGNITGK
jgi:hypothetical protein